MQDNQREKAFLERRLEKASRYVSDLWMPVNTSLLEDVQAQLEISGADCTVDKIFNDVKGDCSLYMYCIRELCQLITQDGGEVSAKTPRELFEQAGVEQLKLILSVEPTDISRHSLHSITSLQVARFQEIMTSASASQILCENEKIDPELGFSISMLRQLGFALIAWNYPGVYQQAVTSMRRGDTLDLAVAKILGYSPSLLGARVARNWGLPPQFMAYLDPEIEGSEEEESAFVTDAIAGTIATICRVSETLARANNPEVYPSARADWNQARIEIEERLGPSGLQTIQKRFHENCLYYVDSAPGIFKAGLILDPEVRIAATRQVRLVERNPFIPQSRPQIQAKLTGLYDALENNQLAKQHLEKLVKEIIPLANFSGGCVYTVDPSLGLLIPQLHMGKTVIRSKDPVGLSSKHDQVASAFEAATPIVQDHIVDSDTTYTSISGVIGFSQRIGVLYLEVSRLVYQQSPDHHLIHFKAICQALNDCLELI